MANDNAAAQVILGLPQNEVTLEAAVRWSIVVAKKALEEAMVANLVGGVMSQVNKIEDACEEAVEGDSVNPLERMLSAMVKRTNGEQGERSLRLVKVHSHLQEALLWLKGAEIL